MHTAPTGIAAMYLSQQGISRRAAFHGVDMSPVANEGRAVQLEFIRNLIDKDHFKVGDTEITSEFVIANRANAIKVYQELGLYLATLIAVLDDCYDDENRLDSVILTGRCVETEAGTQAMIEGSARKVLNKWYPESSRIGMHLASDLAQGNRTINAFAQALGAAYLGNQALRERHLAAVTGQATRQEAAAEYDVKSFPAGTGDYKEVVVGIPGVSAEEDAKNIAAVKELLGDTATVKIVSDAGSFEQYAKARTLTGIMIDPSINMRAMPAEEKEALLRDINLIRDTKGVIFTLNEISVKTKTRDELVGILKAIAANLERMKAENIDEAMKLALQKENSNYLAKVRALADQRKAEIAPVYNEGIDTVRYCAAPRAIGTTEGTAKHDQFAFDNFDTTAGKGFFNYFIFGDTVKTRDEAVRYIQACGYKGDINRIKFIDKTGLTYEQLVARIAAETGLRAEDVGIRALEGEFDLSQISTEKIPGTLLEISSVTINGHKIYAAMNSYQALLKVMAGDLDVPGVLDGTLKGAFKYLPRTLPIDYGRELEAYQNAVAQLLSAA